GLRGRVHAERARQAARQRAARRRLRRHHRVVGRSPRRAPRAEPHAGRVRLLRRGTSMDGGMRLRTNTRRGAVVAVTTMLTLVALSAVPATAGTSGTQGRTCDGAWHIAASDNPASRFNELMGVAAVS